MPYLGKEKCFTDLLMNPADERMIDLLLQKPIRSVLDVGCAEGAALLTSYYSFGSSHLEGIESTDYDTGSILEQLDAIVPPEDSPWTKLDHSGYREKLKIANVDVHEYAFLRGEYDLIILSNVIHYWSKEEARFTLGRIGELIANSPFIYLRVKLGLNPNGFEPDRMDDSEIESITRECAKTWALDEYFQIIDGQEHYTFTNIPRP